MLREDVIHPEFNPEWRSAESSIVRIWPMSADAPYRPMPEAIKHREELNRRSPDRVRGSTLLRSRTNCIFANAAVEIVACDIV